MPRPCQNGRETAAASGHPRGIQTASYLGACRLTPCQKRPSKPYQVDIATQLGMDANNFADDVGVFLGDQSISGLSPGWQSEYAQVRTDLGAAASDCGVPHAGM